jgi:uncharacterized coiled-coil protein SlyX
MSEGGKMGEADDFKYWSKEELERLAMLHRSTRAGQLGEKLFAAEAKVTEQAATIAALTETLANSEEYRRAYQAGKMALYSMGTPFTEAAMQHLPCGEGALDRRFTRLIEMPRLAEQAATIAALELRLSDQHATIVRLRDALFDARRKATEVVDLIVMYRHKYSERSYLDGAGRVRNEVSAIIDAALNPQPSQPEYTSESMVQPKEKP